MLEYAKINEEEFVPIINFVLEDTDEIKQLKSLYQKEEAYADFLGPIESFIAHYFYYDDPKLKDVVVKKALKKVQSNLDKEINFFTSTFEKELVGVIYLILKKSKRKITKHELLLVLKYILWSIDNRKHLGHPQAYLNWVCDFFNLLDKGEKEELDEFYDDYGKEFDIEDEKINVMKNKEIDIEPSEKDVRESKADSENFDENDKDQFWEEEVFIESLSSEDMKNKMNSFHMKNNEDVNYNCKECNKKISLHNKDWHNCLCDDCFDRMSYN